MRTTLSPTQLSWPHVSLHLSLSLALTVTFCDTLMFTECLE
jgi:hypothetical protein